MEKGKTFISDDVFAKLHKYDKKEQEIYIKIFGKNYRQRADRAVVYWLNYLPKIELEKGGCFNTAQLSKAKHKTLQKAYGKDYKKKIKQAEWELDKYWFYSSYAQKGGHHKRLDREFVPRLIGRNSPAFKIRVSEVLYRFLKQVSAEEGKSISQKMREVLEWSLCSLPNKKYKGNLEFPKNHEDYLKLYTLSFRVSFFCNHPIREEVKKQKGFNDLRRQGIIRERPFTITRLIHQSVYDYFN